MREKKQLQDRLEFLRRAEGLKDTLRSGNTSTGRRESTAEHSWRLALMVITFSDLMPNIDLLKLLKLCVLHDLGEVIDGDIPAPQQAAVAGKSEKERADFISLLEPLPAGIKAEFLALWDDYENASSDEAKLAKAFDKIETLLQHNQGLNLADFDYGFNLEYGRKYTDADVLTSAIRAIIDEETRQQAGEN